MKFIADVEVGLVHVNEPTGGGEAQFREQYAKAVMEPVARERGGDDVHTCRARFV